MLKKILMLSLTFIFITVQANAATGNSLKTIFDELNYSLTVEWDQKDKTFYDAQMAKFSQKIAEAQAAGMSSEEIMQYAISQLKNESVAKELQTTLSLVKVGVLSQAEGQRLLLDTLKKSQVAGASWNGNAAILLIPAIFVGVIILIAYATRCKGEEVYTGTVYTCRDVCTGPVDHEFCHEECGDEDQYECVESTTQN